MRGQQTPATPPRVSFGIELEFLVAYVYEGQPDPDENIKDQLQPLVVVPKDTDPFAMIPSNFGRPSKGTLGETRFHEPKRYIFDKMRNVLTKAGLPVYGADERDLAPGSVQASHSKKAMSSFDLTDDMSLNEVNIDGYEFQRVELISPAMYDMGVSFDMIRLAVSVLTNSFRCRVNPTCGFHVHVGVGPSERIDARTLRNFAALLWAADPLISRLHSPWRSVTAYSQSGRVNEATMLGKNRAPGELIAEQLTTNRYGRETGGPIGGAWLSHQGALPMVPTLTSNDWKNAKYLGRDRQLGESVDPDMDEEAVQRAIDMDIEDDVVLLRGEPWTRRANLPPVAETIASMPGASDAFGLPAIDYKAPVPRPKNYGTYRNSAIPTFAPPRPRPPPISRRYPRVPGTMREDKRDDHGFLAPYLPRHNCGGSLQEPEPRVAPRRRDVVSGVRDLLGADMTAAQVGEMMRNPRVAKHINYKFDGYSMSGFRKMQPIGKGEEDEGEEGPYAGLWRADWATTTDNTVEFREAAGSLDADWIATWARVCCRLLEWSRDAAPSEYMAVIRLLAWAQEEAGAEYDVVDLLIDLGLLAEARFCEERIHRGDAAWWECLNVKPSSSSVSEGEGAAAAFFSAGDDDDDGNDDYSYLGHLEAGRPIPQNVAGSSTEEAMRVASAAAAGAAGGGGGLEGDGDVDMMDEGESAAAVRTAAMHNTWAPPNLAHNF